MNTLLNVSLVHQHIVRYLETLGISKTRLGEILIFDPESQKPQKVSHAQTANQNRVYISRANTFLAKDDVSLRQLNALSAFFQKDVTWFLFSDPSFALPYTSYGVFRARSEKETRQQIWGQVYGSLSALGFSTQKIEYEIQRLRQEWNILRKK